MLYLVADSGSTKTDWILLSAKGIVKQIKTIGFNPYFQTKDTIIEELSRSLLPSIKEDIPNISKVIYYGAGCSNVDNCSLVENSIRSVINVPEIFIHHDLLAAARALCGSEKGIACILGTGSNSCLYDGIDVVENIPSFGYLFGDYGSGACIGKQIIQDYFSGIMPKDLLEAFEADGYHREIILDNVYKRSMPSKYLATVSLFAGKHLDHDYIQGILGYCFENFYESQVSKYSDAKTLKVHFVGSIGYHYQTILKQVTENLGFTIGRIIQSPIEGLISYHQRQLA